MIVYHGSNVRVEKPMIITSEYGRDFGFAFYTTDIKEQAERWAVRRARNANRIGKNGTIFLPIVNVYEWDEFAIKNVKRYTEPSMDWLDMVVNCRSDVDFKHNYDIVIGKIANDTVGETVQYVLQGIMRKEDAIERLKFEKINNQIAFCTEEALNSLRFIDYYEVK